ncbi:MAG: VpsF family polysaccharide biosynthesis protein [Hyphomicrobiales bacterium]|nr:VpsF family polysaccharide biosynthesis protein [Hyphomicrobiales bacterium]
MSGYSVSDGHFDARDHAQRVRTPGNRATVPPLHMALAKTAFWLFCIAVVARVLVGDMIINQFWHYSDTGGSLPGKIHPSNYTFMMCGLLMYLGPGIRFREADLPVVRAILVFAAVTVAINFPGLLRGQTGSIGYIVDTYFCTMLAALVAMSFPYRWRATAAFLIIGAVVLNSFIAMGEFAAGRYIVHFEVLPAEFRPAGVLGAALNVGVINLSAMLLLISTRLNLIWRAGGLAVLCLGVFISGSRTAMLATATFVPLAILLTAHVRKKGISTGAAVVTMLLAAIVVAPLIVIAASELGFLDRFSGGLVDDSAKTRVEIFKVFGFVGWSDILLGSDVDAIRKMALERLGIIHIESPFVTFIFSFGLPMTVVFLVFLVWFFYRLARNTHPVVGLTLLAFLIVALSNNTLSTKVPSFFIAIILAIGMRAYHRRVTALE